MSLLKSHKQEFTIFKYKIWDFPLKCLHKFIQQLFELFHFLILGGTYPFVYLKDQLPTNAVTKNMPQNHSREM